MDKRILVKESYTLVDSNTIYVIQYLLDQMETFELQGGPIIDKESFFDNLIDCLNVYKVNSYLIFKYLNWMIFENLQNLEGDYGEKYDDLVAVTRSTIIYLSKVLLKNEKLLKYHLSFSSISSEGQLTLFLEDFNMEHRNKIEEDVRTMLLEDTPTKKPVCVSIREPLSIFKEIDDRYDMMLDHAKLIIDIIRCLNRRLANKEDLRRRLTMLNLSDYLLRDDIYLDPWIGDTHNKDTLELLVQFSCSLMSILQSLEIYKNGKLTLVPINVDPAGICFFVSEPLMGNINVEEISFF